jgi:hypothetical protein
MVSCESGLGGWWGLDGVVSAAALDLLDYGYVYGSCGAGPVDGSLLGACHVGEVSVVSGGCMDWLLSLCSLFVFLCK